MKIVDSILYLEFNDALECLSSNIRDKERHLRKELSRGAKWLTSIKDPSDNRKVLIEFESLPDDKKQKVVTRFGNPYENIAKQPIRSLVTKDLKAEEYFLQFRYNEGKKLPIETVNDYTKAASWLNTLLIIRSDRKQIKKMIPGISIGDFWKNVIEIINLEKIPLPTNPKRLFEKIDTYEKEKYACIVHKGYGHTNSRKVNSELAEALLLQLAAQPHHDDIKKTQAYNAWAVLNDHQEITSTTFGNWRRKHEYQIMASKNGSKDWYNKFGKQIQRNRPSAPLLLVGSDDNDLDLYFQYETTNKKGHRTTNYWHRYKMIVVMDAFNDYILGYAIADDMNADLIRLAYLDAMYHINELTEKGFYLPHQIQTDRWGSGTLDGFYNNMGIYTPATARAPRGKYIERAFGVHWHQQLKFYPNYAGYNITAKTKLNDEHVDRIKKDFPTKDQAHQQVEHFINSMRNLVDEKTGKTRQQQWLEAFNASPLSQQKQIGEMQLLITFGNTHDYKNTITNKGITPAINCIERSYEIPDEYYLQTVGKRVQVIYEPFDYSRILVTDGGNLRFIAHEYEKGTSCIADEKPGDRKRLNDRIEQKKMHVQLIASKNEKQQKTLKQNNINAEGLLRIGATLPKEIQQQAVIAYHQQRNEANDTSDPFDLM
jgi:hypothetical protein